jgi:DNA-binding GntR family transcriptional regulator
MSDPFKGKGLASMIVERHLSVDGDDEGSKGDEGHSIAKDLIKAIKSGDAAGVDEALSAHYDYCAKQHDEKPEEEDDDESEE